MHMLRQVQEYAYHIQTILKIVGTNDPVIV